MGMFSPEGLERKDQMTESRKLLEGVKVVELATFIAAATTGRFLACLLYTSDAADE